MILIALLFVTASVGFAYLTYTMGTKQGYKLGCEETHKHLDKLKKK